MTPPLAWPNLFPVGCLHHATFLKQSPPLDGEAYREFLRHELRSMKDAGFNSFTLECEWQELEKEDGVFDFSRADAARDSCAELGLGLFVWLFTELTPRWFARAHADCLAVAASGWRSPSHSYAHPVAREHVRRFIHAVVGRYGTEASVLGYDVAVETGLHWVRHPDSASEADRLFDYNDVVAAGFRGWLARRHGGIERLNALWRDCHRSFDDIEPPRSRSFRDNSMSSNQVPWLEWRTYVGEMITDYVRFKAEAVREVDPSHPVGSHLRQIDPAHDGQWLPHINGCMDVTGVSLSTGHDPEDAILASCHSDHVRSAGGPRPFWVSELRLGPNAWGLGQWALPPSAADTGRFSWLALAQGATAIQYRSWRPPVGGLEIGGHGLVERDGSPTPRLARSGAIARALNRDPGFSLSLAPPSASIAILDSPRSRILAAGETSDRLIVLAQRGVYSALRTEGFTVDFIADEDVVRGALSAYRLLALPLAYSLDAEVGKRIAQFVEAGGYLFAGAFCGARDEWGFAQPTVPGHGLDLVFAAREARIEPAFAEGRFPAGFGDAPEIRGPGRPALTVTTPLPGGTRLEAHDAIFGFACLTPLRVTGEATVVAQTTASEPAVTFHRYGRGGALLFGSLPVPETEFSQGGLAALLADLANLAGITPNAVIEDRADRPVEARLVPSSGGGALLVLLNAGAHAARLAVHLTKERYAAAVDMETGERAELRLAGEDTRIVAHVGAGDGRAFRLSRA